MKYKVEEGWIFNWLKHWWCHSGYSPQRSILKWTTLNNPPCHTLPTGFSVWTADAAHLQPAGEENRINVDYWCISLLGEQLIPTCYPSSPPTHCLRHQPFVGTRQRPQCRILTEGFQRGKNRLGFFFFFFSFLVPQTISWGQLNAQLLRRRHALCGVNKTGRDTSAPL